MNGRVAKTIRKEIYGDQSLKQQRKYKRGNSNTKGNVWGTIENVGLRAEYQKAKKIYYQNKSK